MQLRAILLALSLCASGAQAQQADTLADIRQDLAILTTELQRLRQELNTTGASDVMVTGGTLDRVNSIESELQRVTSKAEELQHRIDTVVQDGTTRISNLEFRLCELEPGCDLGSVGQARPLGGEAPQTSAQAPAPAPDETLPTGGAELAVGEETDFRRAQEALATGDFQGAADKFAAFRQTYPGSPLEPSVLLGEGQALAQLGDTRGAAGRYLEIYSNYPDREVAPEALWRLGAALGALGSVSEGCITLNQVVARYPSTPAVAEAQTEMGRLGCQ